MATAPLLAYPGRERQAMAEYTPNMKRIRDEYVEMRQNLLGLADTSAGYGFDRDLAAHDAEIAAQALIDARHLVIGTPGFAALTARAKEIRESATASKGHE